MLARTAVVAVAVAVVGGAATVASLQTSGPPAEVSVRPEASTTPAPTATRTHTRPKPEPPELQDPVYLEVGDGALRLDDDRDYVLSMPCSPAVISEGLRISGGRNLVIVGGTVVLPDDEPPGRGLYLVDQTGTVHVEGLRLTGNLGEGINLSQSEGASVQLVNIQVDMVRGAKDTHHADLLQTWAGPRQLVIDGFVGSTSYQGFFLLPNQHYDGPPPERFSLRDVHITMQRGAGYALWRRDAGQSYPLSLVNVWVTPYDGRREDKLFWPTASAWSGVRLGEPPDDLLSRDPGADHPRWNDRCE